MTLVKYKIVPFSRNTKFLGRNGAFTATKLDVLGLLDNICISPITSKGEIGRCRIEIPKEDIKKVIETLKEFL